MSEINTDICVIGGGPAGYVAAVRASQLGAKVVLFEKNELGGTCLNMGCIPTKALLKTAEAYAMTGKFKELGIALPDAEVTVNPEVYHKRKDTIVKSLRAGLAHLMETNGITVISGTVRIKSPHLVEADTADGTVSAACGKIILATGSQAVKPPIPGADLPGVMTSDEALTGTEVPQSIAIIGSGAIGLEFATFYRSLGAVVTVIEMKDRALPEEDAEVSAALLRIMKKSGIKFKLGVRVTEIQKTSDALETVMEESGKTVTVVSQQILLAAGRKPCGVSPELLALGLQADRSTIAVDKYLKTSVDDIYAAGDSVGGKLLAHLAFCEGRIAAENAMGMHNTVNYEAVPACVYTSPEVASVGLSESQAQTRGIEIKTGRFELRANGRALCHGERDGFVKVVTDSKTGVILGGCILGHDASEMISVLTLAVRLGLKAEALADTIFPHPTISEAISEACADAIGRAIHK